MFRDDSQKTYLQYSALSYQERLLKLNLESLELRRLRLGLTYYFKIFDNLTPLDPNKFSIIYQSNPIHLVLNQPPSTDRLRLQPALFPPFPVDALMFGIGSLPR